MTAAEARTLYSLEMAPTPRPLAPPRVTLGKEHANAGPGRQESSFQGTAGPVPHPLAPQLRVAPHAPPAAASAARRWASYGGARKVTAVAFLSARCLRDLMYFIRRGLLSRPPNDRRKIFPPCFSQGRFKPNKFSY